MNKIILLYSTATAVMAVCSLSGCQTTYSALPAAGGFGTVSAASRPTRPVVEEPEALVASVAAQPFLLTTSRPQMAEAGTIKIDQGAAPYHALRPVTGLQAPSPDTLLQQKQAEAPRLFGVTQAAHIAGGVLVLAGGITTISGLHSDEPGFEPLAIAALGVILAIIGGAMLLFRGKTAHRRQKQA